MSIKKIRPLLLASSAILLSLVGLFCAHQGAPAGGPVDKVPPQVVHTYPVNQTLQYRDHKFAFEFSKYVDRRSVEEAIFCSPNLGELTFDWGGKDVEVQFAGALRESTTYIITLGTDVVDIRNHNRMADAFSLAFSTGDHIDSGAVAGQVYSQSPEGIMIFAYQLDGRAQDTLSPSRSLPDYLTQTGKDGLFMLRYLKIGRYRLIAVRDEYKNLLYDPQTDEYGVTSSDILLNAERPFVSGLQFRMTSVDTTPPFLSSARPLDRNHVLLRFSKSMGSSGIELHNISIVDTAKGDGLSVMDFSFVARAGIGAGEKRQGSDAQLVTADQESTKAYRITLRNFRDSSGNAMPMRLASGVFAGSSAPDTVKPILTFVNISEGSKTIQRDDSIRMNFSEAVQKRAFEDGFAVYDSSGKRVPGEYLWGNSIAVTFAPSSGLAFGMPYTVKVVLDSLVDFVGNRYKDSTRVMKFQVIDESQLGSMKGAVADDSTITKGRIIVTATAISSRDIRPQYRTLEKPGPFAFEELPEGQYVLSAIIDVDSNGVYSYGKPFPFQPAERFMQYNDTLKVRARWPLEGIAIRFK